MQLRLDLVNDGHVNLSLCWAGSQAGLAGSFAEKGVLECTNMVKGLRAFVSHEDMKASLFLTYRDKSTHTRFLLANPKPAKNLLILLLIVVQNGELQVEA